ncbi:VWA domain-containing protein [Streptomyces xantholiticus]|uniref:VWA domain-containing protein n=1 Tax=Streptomyces xantholiticus TaxID=68285 RepID=UPI001673B579|nr:VWA domain-containing protein [Streptomyces xantholiticus]
MAEGTYEALLEEQASHLSRLRIERGNPSLRAIEERASKLFTQEKASLPIATQSAAFNGRYVGLDKLMWLVRSLMSWDQYGDDCTPPGRRAPELNQWRTRWVQITLARPKRRKPTASPADGMLSAPGYDPSSGRTDHPVHVIWLLDCSHSMSGEKAAQLNYAMREAIVEMREVAKMHPTVGLEMRAGMFSAGARWHMEGPVDIDLAIWRDVYADDSGGDGACDMGAAFRLAASALHVPPMPQQAPPPVLALVSGTQPTDDWRSGLRELAATPWGSQAVRIAIPVGADADRGVLEEFLSNTGLRPIDAGAAPRQVAAAIRWAAETVAEPWAADDDDVW